MKKYTDSFTSPTTRALAYLCAFIVGSALARVAYSLTTGETNTQGLITLSVFVIVGAIFICERHVLSRITSASTMLILGAIVVKFGHTPIHDSYLLAFALFVSLVGAHPALHRAVNNKQKTILRGSAIAFVGLVVFIAFVYTVTIISRLAIAEHLDKLQ